MPPRVDGAFKRGNKRTMASRSSRRTFSTANPAERARKKSRYSLLRFILVVALFAWAFRSLVAAPFNIPSGSMLPTLYIGDYVAVAKWPYGYSSYSFPFEMPALGGRIFEALPKRGDVVVFRHPGKNADLIKRVIALPGDTIEVRGGQLILNNHPVPRRALPPAKIAVSVNSPCRVVLPAGPTLAILGKRTFCVYRAYVETLPGGPDYTVLDQLGDGPADDFPATRVPQGHLFLLGDNRDDSFDSRFPADEGGIGMVPTKNLIGKAMITFWSTDGSAFWFKPWTWIAALRSGRIGNRYTGLAQ